MPSRRGVVLLLGALLLAAAPAQAAGGITSPGPGEVVTHHQVLPLRAVVEGPVARPSELVLVEAGSDVEQVVAVSTSPDGGELAHDLDTTCAQPVCTGQVPARNGTWTLRLRGAASDERTFDLRIPPLAPLELTAEPAGDGALLQWRLGPEPDLTGYTVVDGAGASVRVAAEACDADGRCRVPMPAGADSWQVLAHRPTCPDCHEELSSPPAQVQLGAAPPTAPPTPQTGSGSRSGPAVPDQRSAFARAFGEGRPATVPVPRPPGARAAPAPDPDGAYDVELGYDVPQSAPGPGGTSVGDALSALGSADRVRLALLSGLMIGTAWWLRRWARRVIAE